MSNISYPIGGQERFAAVAVGHIMRSAGHQRVRGYLPGGATPQSDVITLGGATNDGVYTLTIAITSNGSRVSESVSYTADSSATADEIVAGLAAAVDAATYLPGFLEGAEASASADTVTLTGKPGVTFTTTLAANPSTDMSLASTAAAVSPSYAFGQAVQIVDAPAGQPEASIDDAIQMPALVDGAVLTLAITHAGSQTLSATITHTPYDGAPEAYALSVSTAGSASATDDAVVAALEAQYPAATVTNPSTGSVVITFPGGDKASASGATGSGGADLEITSTAPAILPPVGVVLWDSMSEQSDVRTGVLSTSASTEPGVSVAVIRPGDGSTAVGVTASEASSAYQHGGPVWYGADSTVTDEYGLFFTAAGAGRLPAPGLTWDRITNDTTIAALAL